MMENGLTGATPSKLYAFLLKLRPLEYGTLMPFSGELVHAAWLSWLRSAAPDVATWLHEGNKRRLFTCSSLQFPIPAPRMLNAEHDNTHLPVDPEKTYTVRITLLLGELFPLFYEALMNFNARDTGATRPPFMQLGKRSFLLEEVVIANDDPTGWTGFTSFAGLVEKAQAQKLNNIQPLTLEFASLTTFSRGNSGNKFFDNHYARLPWPQYVFANLARRWQELAPPELASIIQPERLDHYIQDDGVVIEDYTLRTHQVSFTKHIQPGFTGSCTYHLRGPDDPPTDDAHLTLRQQILLLAQLAFYTGVGYKTAMGMGRVRNHLSKNHNDL
jgi:CRISPR-associated endoribonuclease Cas6